MDRRITRTRALQRNRFVDRVKTWIGFRPALFIGKTRGSLTWRTLVGNLSLARQHMMMLSLSVRDDSVLSIGKPYVCV